MNNSRATIDGPVYNKGSAPNGIHITDEEQATRAAFQGYMSLLQRAELVTDKARYWDRLKEYMSNTHVNPSPPN